MLAPDVLRRFNRSRFLSDEGGTVGNFHPPLSMSKLVFLHPRSEGRPLGRLRLAVGGQPASRKDHVDDRKTKNRKAKRCEAEEAKAWHSVPLELAVDDKVGRGGHERHHAAYEGSEAERHHQPPGPMPVLCEMRSTTGMKIAVTAVELIVAPSEQTTSMSSTVSRTSFDPAFAMSQSPSR